MPIWIWVSDLLSHLIHSSRVVVAARAHQWACSPEVSCISHEESLSLQQDWCVLVGSGSPLPPTCSPLLHLRWSFREAKMSLVISHSHLGPHGRGPDSLLREYTWLESSPISSQVVQYPTSWAVEVSASGSSLGRPCLHPWQTNLSTSFCPDSAACMNSH